jgi:hypothetical protein
MKQLILFLIVCIFVNSLSAQKGKKVKSDSIDTSDKFYTDGLAEFNRYQRSVGNKEALLNDKLVEAAKKHAEYLTLNHINTPMTLEWHNEVEGNPGFIGKNPEEQAKAMGFSPSENHWVVNTMGSFSNFEAYSTPEYIFHHLASTIYHRGMIVGMEYEAIGFYRHTDSKTGFSLLVFFGSQKLHNGSDRLMRYPGKGQTDISVGMLPEIPQPFESLMTGFPISVQLNTSDYEKGITIVSAEIISPKGKKLPLLTLSQDSEGEAGKWAKLLKLVAIATKGALEPNSKYTVKLKLKDTTGKIVFNETWSFTTDDGKMKFLGIDFKDAIGN